MSLTCRLPHCSTALALLLSRSPAALRAEPPPPAAAAPAGHTAPSRDAWIHELQNAAPGTESEQDPGTPIGPAGEQRFANPGSEAEGGAGADEAGSGVFAEEEGPSFFGVVLRFLALMGLMLGGFYFVMRYMKRRSGMGFAANGSEVVQVLLSVPLVQGKFLQVVDVAGKLLVLGVSDAGVQMLTTVEDGSTVDRLRLWQSRQEPRAQVVGVVEQLARLVTGGDFRFWKSEAGHTARTRSFREMLGAETAVPAAGPRESEAPNEDGLRDLLKEQRRRLSRLKQSNKE